MGPCLTLARGLVRGGTVNDKTDTKVFSSAKVGLSPDQKGPNVNVMNLEVMGKGAVCADEGFEFDRTYFEVIIKRPGKFAIGVAQRSANPLRDFDKEIGNNKTSWALKSDMLAAVPEPGDAIGVLVDQSEGSPKLSFLLNGLPLGDLYDTPRPRSDVKIPSDVFPAISVDKSAVLEFHFQDRMFKYPAPMGYNTVVSVKDLVYA